MYFILFFLLVLDYRPVSGCVHVVLYVPPVWNHAMISAEVTEEPGVVQMHDGMLLPTDVNIHRHPIICPGTLKRPARGEKSLTVSCVLHTLCWCVLLPLRGTHVQTTCLKHTSTKQCECVCVRAWARQTVTSQYIFVSTQTLFSVNAAIYKHHIYDTLITHSKTPWGLIVKCYMNWKQNCDKQTWDSTTTCQHNPR